MPFIQHACSAHQHPCSLDTLSHRITWLPKACRNAAVRQQVAEAVIKAICGAHHTPSTRFTTRNAGFGESTDAFPLPKGYSLNPDLQAHPHASSEIGIGSEDPMKGPQK